MSGFNLAMGSKNKLHHQNGHRHAYWKWRNIHKVKYLYTSHISKHATTQPTQDKLVSSTSTLHEIHTPNSHPPPQSISTSQTCVTQSLSSTNSSSTTENQTISIRTPNSHPQSNTNQMSSTNSSNTQSSTSKSDQYNSKLTVY